MKSIIITIFAILAFSIPTFAQNNAVTNNMTAKDKAEYTLKFLVKETTLTTIQLNALRKIFLESAEKQTDLEKSLKNSDPQKINQTLGVEKAHLDQQVEEVLDGTQYQIYVDIRDNLSTKIAAYKIPNQPAVPTTK